MMNVLNELQTEQTNFRDYLAERIEPGSVNSYLGYIKKINEILSKHSISSKELLEIIDTGELSSVIQKLNSNEEYKEYNIKWKNGLSAPLNHYKKFIETINATIKTVSYIDFQVNSFFENLTYSGLLFTEKIITRFISSIITKPFVILSGLSGSGKTKLAQAFVHWICVSENQNKIVPVGADWTNREPLLGYPNALDQTQYIKPDNGIVDLMLHARNNPKLPHFLILDEMNLSHVERYFADFLSAMESGGNISFHSGEKEKNGVPSSITIPDNMFIIGTINVDETTYMFSPKVLDRANVIEFRISENEMKEFLNKPLKPNLDEIKSKGALMAESFMMMARNKIFENPANGNLNNTLIEFFSELKKTGAEFGYRNAYEIHRLINQLSLIDPKLNEDEKLDIAIMQKLLPKLHGSRRKLYPVLLTLGEFCVQSNNFKDIEKEIFLKEDFDYTQVGVKFPLSLEKLSRMFNGAVDNGFASYAEA
jgi:5-methylcytosine-specific restriction protein B